MFFHLCGTRELFAAKLAVGRLSLHGHGSLVKFGILVGEKGLLVFVLFGTKATIKGNLFGRPSRVAAENFFDGFL